jgi:putative ATPase
LDNNKPLAERLRPQTLSEYVGQTHVIGSGTALYESLQRGKIPSFILWGPPGVGKTTLASIIANNLTRQIYFLSAINSGVKDIRDIIDKAESKTLFSGGASPILFIDEIHRFSKSQQDALLNAVEKGTIVLIGATTENPSFEVIAALLSRCQVYKLNELTREDLIQLVDRALANDLQLKKISIKVNQYDALIQYSGGDARRLLNVLELVVNVKSAENPIIIDNATIKEVIQNNLGAYDKTGESHYDTISAFIKSVRGSDPNASVYYLAKMLIGGEDPLFICRRMIILASEDIGLANPNALLLANNCFQATHQIGMPEARIVMSQCAIYLACSPKSNSAYAAIGKAYEMIKHNPHLSIPLSLRNAPTSLMKDLGYGTDYLYSHNYEDNFTLQDFLPKEIIQTNIYSSGQNPAEQKMIEKIKKFWEGYYQI